MKHVREMDSKRTAIYARVARAEEGSAERLAEQVQNVTNGLPTDLAAMGVEVYAETGSGLLGFEPDCEGERRPEFERLAMDIRKGWIGSVHFADLARLSRSLSVATAFLDLCDRHGVRVFVDGTEGNGRAFFGHGAKASVRHVHMSRFVQATLVDRATRRAKPTA